MPRLSVLTSDNNMEKYPRKEIVKDGLLVIHSTKFISHSISPPGIYPTVYTHREMITLYYTLQNKGVKSLKTLAESLSELNMLPMPFKTLKKKVDIYKDAIEKGLCDSCLPPVYHQYTSVLGAPKKIESSIAEAAFAMNNNAHRSVSKATDPLENILTDFSYTTFSCTIPLLHKIMRFYVNGPPCWRSASLGKKTRKTSCVY